MIHHKTTRHHMLVLLSVFLAFIKCCNFYFLRIVDKITCLKNIILV
uniref:Uncharacterized protein n=1 Tax=Heterorhabditis bacteriophora TaxID=37862 RepID=A0A1I7X1Q7_HETBA